VDLPVSEDEQDEVGLVGLSDVGLFGFQDHSLQSGSEQCGSRELVGLQGLPVSRQHALQPVHFSVLGVAIQGEAVAHLPINATTESIQRD